MGNTIQESTNYRIVKSSKTLRVLLNGKIQAQGFNDCPSALQAIWALNKEPQGVRYEVRDFRRVIYRVHNNIDKSDYVKSLIISLIKKKEFSLEEIISGDTTFSDLHIEECELLSLLLALEDKLKLEDLDVLSPEVCNLNHSIENLASLINIKE